MNTNIIRVFPRRTHWTPVDEFAFYGPPPLFRPEDRSIPVHVSVTFTWDLPRAQKLALQWAAHYETVLMGGPVFNDSTGEFQPGLYLKEGCTITSRGCPKNCWYCDVPTREGKLKLLRDWEAKPGWIVQDNNLLSCPDDHVSDVFWMLRTQERNIFFNGGLDKHFFKPFHRELLDTIPIGELWWACDDLNSLPALEKIVPLLDGIPLRKNRCYTMVTPDKETMEQAEYRLNRVLELGFLPFCQLYQSHSFRVYPKEWLALQRKWSRAAAILAKDSATPEPELQFEEL